MLALSEDALVLSLDSELTLVVLLLVELAVEELCPQPAARVAATATVSNTATIRFFIFYASILYVIEISFEIPN